MSSLLVIAGEISGDMHAAAVVRVLRAQRPDLQVYGIGGDRLRAEGMEILVDARRMAVLGLWEVLKHYRFLSGVFHQLVRVAEERRPDAVLLVDYPGFNLRYAAEMKRRGICVMYYVCPQVWAWHRSRIAKMARIIDRLLVIFPFEVEVFAGTGLAVEYVGHPLVDAAARERAAPEQPLPWPGSDRLALMPGSRRQELDRILPPMWRAAGLLAARRPGLGVVIAAPNEELAAEIRSRVAALPGGPPRAEVVAGATRQILRQARAALVKSGTSTLEAALMGCPFAVVYRAAAVTYQIGRRLIRVPYLGMANLVLGREAFTEYIQDAATPEALADAATRLLDDGPPRSAVCAACDEVRRALGEGGAAERAAAAIAQALPRAGE